MTAIRQIEEMGFSARDVRHIVLTHLDFDHAGGLDDFPQAQVHLLEKERNCAFAQRTWLDRQRFRPQQWSTQKDWKVYQVSEGDRWYGFDQVRPLEGVLPEIVLIPLIGHTQGHVGVAVRDENRWLFLTGDAYFFHQEMDFDHPRCTIGLTLYQLLMEKNHQARVQNQNRLRQLRREHQHEVNLFCSHDVLEFERLSGRSAEVPLPKMRSNVLFSRTGT